MQGWWFIQLLELPVRKLTDAPPAPSREGAPGLAAVLDSLHNSGCSLGPCFTELQYVVINWK